MRVNVWSYLLLKDIGQKVRVGHAPSSLAPHDLYEKITGDINPTWWNARETIRIHNFGCASLSCCIATTVTTFC